MQPILVSGLNKEIVKGLNLPKRVRIFDTTLRDGEQTPGVSLTPDQKMRIARQLNRLGVDCIEAGFPVVSEGEYQAVKKIAQAGLDSEICALARCSKEDVDLAVECGVESVHLFIATSDIHLKYKLRMTRNEVLKRAVKYVKYAKRKGVMVEFSAEDATRTELSFLKEVYKQVVKAGADRINVPDTVGVITPRAMYQLISSLKQEISVPISVHCHDDFGLAVSNSLAAVEAGAEQVHVTVNGLGERAGNASLEEVVTSLHYFYGFKTGIKLRKLYQTSELVERLKGIPVPPNKAIVGDNAFSHESGIHTHGVLRFPGTYEPLSPELVGQKRRFILGKHVGMAFIRNELKKLGIKASEKQIREIFSQVKALGDKGKMVTDAEWRAIVDSVLGRSFEEMVKLQELTVVSGNKITPTASVRLLVNGKELQNSGIGVGPVDAAMNAIRKVLEGMSNVKLQEYHVDAISGGTDAVVSVVVKLTDGRKIITSRGTSSDIIMASVQAMLAGVNRFLWDRRMKYARKNK
ncbi:MAG: 2-isopropylmalate synthase [Hadesarchaea archaeon]|nr:MAG: 2-isopropylmalate synthase [Hadesarchaea archaeon]